LSIENQNFTKEILIVKEKLDWALDKFRGLLASIAWLGSILGNVIMT